MVMVSNHVSWRTHYLQGKFGGLGLLLPPNGLVGPYPHLPYAMDNGAFPAWTNNEEWDQARFEKALAWARSKRPRPLWVVVPDVVTDAEATFARWHEWAPRLEGFRLALAVQDGMTPDAVDAHGITPEVIFVGGSTGWKMRTIPTWCEAYPRVHVGRINGLRGLMACRLAGAESVDGTGFFRGRHGRLDGLLKYLQEFGPRTMHPMNHVLEHHGQEDLF